MQKRSFLIARYLLKSILPYFLFSWLLLSAILFFQQASRFSDIFFSVNIPANLVWQLTFALVPSVIAFTCPMAVLVGVIIGLAKMQGDSEIVAIRAAGVGNLHLTVPIILLGIVLSAFAFFINLRGVPFAARIVRDIALRTAIKKLESPIEPGVFNTEVAGYTIYVRDADIETGTWKNIFIYTEDPKAGETRLITSTNGRIDSSGELSELVLENGAANTFSTVEGKTKYVSESIGEVRFSIRTRRGELINRLGSAEMTPEELGLSQLSDYAQAKTGPERTEAELLWQRRILLSITPLIFCLLGTSMMLTLRRRGRGFAIVVSLACLVVYYLLTFLGEQLARTGKASVLAAALLPIGASVVAIAAFYLTSRLQLAFDPLSRIGEWFARLDLHPRRIQTRNIFVDVTTGLRDLDLAWTLIKYYLLTVVFLAAVFVIFTAFELWRFAGAMENGTLLLGRYLVYLMPFVYIQIAPSAAMIATLATYVIKSRRNEIVSWTAAGQSVYRLLLPCFVLTILLGLFNCIVQEYVMPSANRVQDTVRTQIRSRGVPQNQSGKLWIARDDRIFSFRFDTAASDNDIQIGSCVDGCALRDLTIYEFAADKAKLQAVYHIPRAVWARDQLVSAEGAQRIDLSAGSSESVAMTEEEIGRLPDPFVGIRRKPSLLSASELKGRIDAAASPVERRSLEVALEKKYVTIFLPFIIALFTAPFALSLRGKGKAATVGYAVGLWLLFVGTTNFFEQFGLNGSLPPAFAVWGPMTIFAMIGVYLLARVRS